MKILFLLKCFSFFGKACFEPRQKLYGDTRLAVVKVELWFAGTVITSELLDLHESSDINRVRNKISCSSTATGTGLWRVLITCTEANTKKGNGASWQTTSLICLITSSCFCAPC